MILEHKDFKVSAYSKVQSLSGAIIGAIGDGFSPRLYAVGAGAVNQAVKAAAAAKQRCEKKLCFDIDFFDAEIGEDTKSGIVITISFKKE